MNRKNNINFRKIKGGANPAGGNTPPANTPTPVSANTPGANTVAAPKPPGGANNSGGNTGIGKAPTGANTPASANTSAATSNTPGANKPATGNTPVASNSGSGSNSVGLGAIQKKIGNLKNNISKKSNNLLNKGSNLLDKTGNAIGNKKNNLVSKGSNLLDKSDNIIDNVKDGKYNKWGFIFVVGISIILIIHFLSYVISYYYKRVDKSPLIIPHTKNAKHTVIVSQDPESINYIPIARSDNEEGIELAYSFWTLILDFDYKNGEWKHIFHKGNSTSYPNRAPGVWLHPNENKMRVYMNTFDNILEYVDIDDIPIKKWFCTTIVLQNSKSHSDKTKDVEPTNAASHILDVYINGNLKKSKLLTSIPRQNNGDLWVNLFGGFSGYVSRLQYHSYAPDYKEIEAYLKNGPSEMTAQDTGEMPPYLDDKWWFTMQN